MLARPPLRRVVAAASLAALAGLGLTCPQVETPPGTPVSIPGLSAPVKVITDRYGSPHLYAENDFDLARVQGYVHARDRFWQMDVTRREVSGDLAEVLGSGSLSGDIQNRTIGLRRGAQRTFDALTVREQALLQAFADGVNHWLTTNPLPPEYATLEITKARPWNPVDTLALGRGIAASLSLSIDAGLVEKLDAYLAKGAASTPPFDGRKLLFEDVQRFAPIDPAATIPDATGSMPFLTAGLEVKQRALLAQSAPAVRRFRERAEKSRLLARALDRQGTKVGSNEWGVAGSVTDLGVPIIANDPHLGLTWPATFYETHLVVADDPDLGPMNVSGVTFPGVPAVILGQNEHVTWGATTNDIDVSDLFRDRIVRNVPGCTSFACIESEGVLHPVEVEIVQYRVNQIGDGIPDNTPIASIPFDQSLVLTVPFRSFGPVVDVDDPGFFLGGATETHVLVLQYTGFHATNEVRTFLAFDRASNLAEFRDGVENFDVGNQNWAYADDAGNLAYFTSSEQPLRKDLEDGAVVGLPPYFVRDGSGPNNWIADPARSQGQLIPYAVLPSEEMPHTINPANGFFVNANNDPDGATLDNDPLNQRRVGKPSAIYYRAPSGSDGLRAGRITRLIRAKLDAGEKISISDMREWQMNVQPLDAEILTPFVLAAFARANEPGAPAELVALAADPRVSDAVARLADWDYSTPTGIAEGWDHTDVGGQRGPILSTREIRNSVAATIQNVWRAKLVRSVIDATLSGIGVPGVGAGEALNALVHLLRQSPFTGVGASGVDFFSGPATLAAAADRRDHAILKALADALGELPGSKFAKAFGGSTNPDDWRWGKLHRVVFSHELGGNFSLPPAAGFSSVSPDLPGLSRDGGYEVVNASGFSAKADNDASFRFGGGPVRRYVGAAGGSRLEGARVLGLNVVPGGGSGVPGHPTAALQLGDWLTGEQHPVAMFEVDALRGAVSVERFESPEIP